MNAKKAKISWDKVCQPKEKSILRLRSLTETNKVCCLKLIWRIISHSTLWFDIWSPLGRLYDLINSRRCVDIDLNINANVEYAVQHYRIRRHRSENLILIEEGILKLRVQGLGAYADVCLWRGKGDIFKSDFHVSQTWRIRPTFHWHMGVWFSGATPKYSVISWIAVHNRLATRDRLLKWNNQADVICILCQTSLEMRDHIYFSCLYFETIWKNLMVKILGLNYCNNWNHVLELFTMNTLINTREFLFCYVFQALVHSLWIERNGRCHGEVRHNSDYMISFIDKQVRNIISSLKGRGGKHLDQAMMAWFA
ncbi:hypothetical protein N665_1724s0005 [Sinapis alba]|nr:hypothetical protein N665_1724s0005 [Sinapis alba]